MELPRNNGEIPWEERLRQHEFPFDERAWVAMEALLKAEVLPPRSASPWPCQGWRRLLQLGLLGVLLWWTHPTPSPEAPYPERVAEAAATLSTLGATLQSKTAEGAALAAAEKVQHRPKPRAELSQRYQPARRQRLMRAETDECRLPTAEAGLNIPLAPGEMEVERVAAEEATAAEHSADRGHALSNPSLPPKPLPQLYPRINESFAKGIKVPSPDVPRVEHGWTAGVSASVTRAHSATLLPAPVVGYVFRYRFNTRLSWQAEAMFKPVSGYALNSWEVISYLPSSFSVGTKNQMRGLIFFEMPLGIHYRYSLNRALFFGIRPSVNVPVRHQATIYMGRRPSSVSISSFTPVHEGLHFFNVGISAGWEWRFHPHWAIHARITQGLNDLVADKIFAKASPLRNTDGQLLLRYFLTPDRGATLAYLQRHQ